MSLPLGSLLALPLPREDRAHLDALISEAAVGRALRAEGHHVASFGLWALRRRAHRQDVLERLLRQPRDWTWLVFAPMPPGQLPAPDAELLARTVQGLHGVQYVEWTVQEGVLSFTSRSLRTAVVRGSPVLLPSPPRPEGSLTLPAGPLLPDLSRWAGVPAEQLGAALIEAAYIERMAPAHQGAFTNVDVLALARKVPVVIEVKRRARTPEQETQPLTMSPTQAGTLGYLHAAGCEVHVAVLVVPKGSTQQPDLALGRGSWHAGAPVIRPGWGEMHVDLLGAAQPLGLKGLRRAREHAALGDLGLGTLGATSPSHAEPLPAAASEWTSLPSCANSAPELKGPQRLISFTSEYRFLQVWAPAPVKLGGRVYPSPAAAFLAARTLDQTAREALTETLSPVRALRLADLAPVRAGWRELRLQVAREVLRMAYRDERGVQLVATLPLLLDAPEMWGPPLDGLQGEPGLNLLSDLRGLLATEQAHRTGGCCLQCAWAHAGPPAGFLQCAHPDGAAGALACVGAHAIRGPLDTVRVAVTTPAGQAFRSKQAAQRP
ncbi:hypothetical protein [Deinococcus marmoris]|uniref:hypothetical protein n=1 Tax=Deinococcus marmoris TaxID=249408 RepID=UPI00049721FE|nr:hypothetical protein [Deinococcus marmoris]